MVLPVKTVNPVASDFRQFRIPAHMRLDADTLMAALLHDVIEDTEFSKEEIGQRVGTVVAGTCR